MNFLFFKLGILSILIWTICSVLSYPTQDNSRNCIKMTPENRAKIQRIKHELAKMLTEYGDSFDDIDIRFVKIDIYKHSDDEDPEQDMVLEFYVNNCENSFNWNAFEETYEFDTDDDNKGFGNGGKDVIKEQSVTGHKTHEIQSEEVRNRQNKNKDIIRKDTENRDNRQENVSNLEEYKETQSIENTRKVEKSEKISNYSELDEQTNVDNRKVVKKERNVSNLEIDDEYINIENRKIVKKHENVINTEIIEEEENTKTVQNNIKTTNIKDTQTGNVETKNDNNVNECHSCIENSKRETEDQNTENGNINNENSKIDENNKNFDKKISKTDTAKNKCKKSENFGNTAEANDNVNNFQNQESDINESDAETIIIKHLQTILQNNKNINIEAICKNMENFQNSKIHNANTNTVNTKETNINTLTENTNSATNNQNTKTTNVNSETTNKNSETTNINSETSNKNVKTTNINTDTTNTNSETTNTNSVTTNINSETINKNIINSFTEISNKETNTQKTSETNIINDKTTANYPIILSTIPFTESPKIDTLNINEILISLKNIFKSYELNTRNNEPQTNINYIFFYDGFHRQFRYPMSDVNGNNNVQLNEMNLKSEQKPNCENEVIVKPRNEASFNTENYKRMLESFYRSYVNYNGNLAGAKPEFFDVNFNKKCN